MNDTAPNLFCFGSFGTFHRGHREFLTSCSSIGKGLLVGVSAEHTRQAFSFRKEAIEQFLKSAKIPFQIVNITDNLEEQVLKPTLNFLAITAKDKELAASLNAFRVSKGRPPLIVIEIPPTLAEDGKPISAERILKGVIDVEGRLVREPLPAKNRSKIRDNLVEIFLQEQGPLYGYLINKKYNRTYGRLSLRLTYYHLAKGVSEGVFRIIEKRKTPGGFSWGGLSERIYYELSK